MTTEALLAAVVMYGLLPVWLVAGFSDYLCHRASDIAHTSGLKESISHVLQLAEVGLPMLAALFFEINGFLLVFMLTGLVLHEATAAWDVRFADRRRRIAPLEQHVHGILERVPWAAFLMLAVLNWKQIAAFDLAWKAEPLPAWYLASVLTAIVLLGVIPYAEELLRCWQAASRAAPEQPRHRGVHAAKEP